MSPLGLLLVGGLGLAVLVGLVGVAVKLGRRDEQLATQTDRATRTTPPRVGERIPEKAGGSGQAGLSHGERGRRWGALAGAVAIVGLGFGTSVLAVRRYCDTPAEAVGYTLLGACLAPAALVVVPLLLLFAIGREMLMHLNEPGGWSEPTGSDQPPGPALPSAAAPPAAPRVCYNCRGTGAGDFACLYCGGRGNDGTRACVFCFGRGIGPCVSCAGTGRQR